LKARHWSITLLAWLFLALPLTVHSDGAVAPLEVEYRCSGDAGITITVPSYGECKRLVEQIIATKYADPWWGAISLRYPITCNVPTADSAWQTSCFVHLNTSQGIEYVFVGAYPQAVCPEGAAPSGAMTCACVDGWTAASNAQKCLIYLDSFPAEPNSCPSEFGNPIFPLTGAKQARIGLHSIGGRKLELVYDTRAKLPSNMQTPVSAPSPSYAFGNLWTSFLQRRLTHQRQSSPGSALQAYRGDGSWISFASDAASTYLPSAEVSDRVRPAVGGGWLYYDFRHHTLEVYGPTGALTALQSADGSGALSLQYEAGSNRLLGVSDRFSRSLRFAYGADGHIKSLSASAAQDIELSYAGDGRLVQLTWQDDSYREMVYGGSNAPDWALTAVVDEDRQHVSRYGYDTEGRAISTERGSGQDRYMATYATPPSRVVAEIRDEPAGIVWRKHGWVPPAGTVVSLPNGSSTALTAVNGSGVPRLSSQTQAAGSGCQPSAAAQTFDGNGNVAQRDDFNGVRSCHAYDLTRNLEVSRVEGLGSAMVCSSVLATGTALPASSRKVSTQWHPDWRLATRTAEPLKLTTSVYNGQPDPFAGGAIASCAPSSATLPDNKPIVVLCKRVEQATTDADGSKGFAAPLQAGVANRVWQYSYNEFGQVLTAKDPVNNLTTYAYYADTTPEHTRGDLQSVTNALNQVTRYTQYNPQGQVLQMMDANGVITDYGYDLRQRLTSVSVAGSISSYEYWPTGLLKRAVQPDGSFVAYGYDDAHRLTAVADAKGNRIEYTLDNAGNRVAEQVKDPGGSLARQLSRVYDALGRVQQASGRE